MSDKPRWGSKPYDGGYAGYFALPGAGTARFVRKNGQVVVLADEREARDLAREVCLGILYPTIRHTRESEQDDPIAKALGVDDWIRSRREDIKNATTMHRAGRRPVLVMKGKSQC